LVLPIQYDKIIPPIRVSKKNTWLNTTLFSDNKNLINCYVVEKNSKYGIIGKKFDIVLPIQYDEFSVEVLSQDIIQCYLKKNNILVNVNTGKIAETKFLAKVVNEKFIKLYPEKICDCSSEYQVGLIDIAGKEIFPVKYHKIYITENHFLIQKKHQTYRKKNIVLTNLEGKTLTEFSLDEIKEAPHNYFVVRKNKKHGIINSEGTIILPLEYDNIDDSWENTYRWKILEESRMARFSKNKKWGYIKISATSVEEFIKPQYESVEGFFEAKAVIEKNGKYGMIDREGNILVNPTYDKIMWNTTYMIFVKSINGEVQMTAEGHIPLDNNENLVICVKKEGIWVLINQQGEILKTTNYKGDILLLSEYNPSIKDTKETKITLFDEKGNILSVFDKKELIK
jgi:hypothetical protein